MTTLSRRLHIFHIIYMINKKSSSFSPLDVEGEGGDISMSMDSPLHRDRLELGVMLGPGSPELVTGPGLLGVRIPAIAGTDTGPYE